MPLVFSVGGSNSELMPVHTAFIISKCVLVFVLPVDSYVTIVANLHPWEWLRALA